MLTHCTSVQIRSQIWKLFYCRTCTAGDSLYCRLPGMGLLILCSTCKASLFWGDGQGSRFIPRVSYAVNLPVIEEKKKRFIHFIVFCRGLCHQDFFNTMDGINVCFLNFFWTCISQSMAQDGSQLLRQKDSVLTSCLNPQYFMIFKTILLCPSCKFHVQLSKKNTGRRQKSWCSFTFYLPCCSFHLYIYVLK